MSADRLLESVDRARLLVAVGSGGVGKTTTAAALALLAARRGRKTLVLTIDPARRLLQALGLDGADCVANTPLPVLPRLHQQLLAGDSNAAYSLVAPEATALDAMMLDPALGAEQMVERLLPNPALREEVLGNRIYRALLPALGASPDLVALELLAELHRRNQYELIVLDTPPTHNTAEFLQAGQTFAHFINEQVLKWFAKVPARDESSRPGFFSRGSVAAMGVLGRLFGSEVLPDIAQFFRSFRDVMPAMRARSEATDALLRSPATRFIAVTAPGETSLREARHMLALLQREGLPFAGFVVNRVLMLPQSLGDEARVQAVAASLVARLQHSGMEQQAAAHLAERLCDGASKLRDLDQADAAHVRSLRALVGRTSFLSIVPQLEHDIHTLPQLCDLGARMVQGCDAAAVSAPGPASSAGPTEAGAGAR